MTARQDIRYRALSGDDHALLVEATLGNMNWKEVRFSADQVLSDVNLRHYVEFDSARGDFGVVVVDGNYPVAVAWALYLPSSDPGYGFVDSCTPELSVWVAPGLRGRGNGRAVTVKLLERASELGVRRVSLSVEPENTRARKLYESLSFVQVEGAEAGVMLREIA